MLKFTYLNRTKSIIQRQLSNLSNQAKDPDKTTKPITALTEKELEHKPKTLQERRVNITGSNLLSKKFDEKLAKREETDWHSKESNYYKFLRIFYTEESKTSTLKALQRKLDFSPAAIKQWYINLREESEVQMQEYKPERSQIVGNEIAAAYFVVAAGGAVKFYGEDRWVKADESKNFELPNRFDDSKILQAIDCSGFDIRYEGLENFRNLKGVEWISFNGSQYLDDWCLDKIGNIFSHSLIYLDLRDCPGISANGLGALYKLRKLKLLYLDDFYRNTIYEITCLLLQDSNPSLDIRSED